MAKGNFKVLLAASETPVLVDFWAEWCAPCHAFAPVLQRFAQENAGKVKVIKIDVDKNPAASNRYAIQSIPTLLLFKDGKAVWRNSGTLPYTALQEALAPHLA